jgi:hypothetical protein
MPSKHANAELLIQCGLYDNLHSFAELEQRVSALGDQNTKAVGDAFEVFVEGYLATNQKMQAEAVWLVGQVPQDIRQQLNLPNALRASTVYFGLGQAHSFLIRSNSGLGVPISPTRRSRRS